MMQLFEQSPRTLTKIRSFFSFCTKTRPFAYKLAQYLLKMSNIYHDIIKMQLEAFVQVRIFVLETSIQGLKQAIKIVLNGQLISSKALKTIGSSNSAFKNLPPVMNSSLIYYFFELLELSSRKHCLPSSFLFILKYLRSLTQACILQ